MDESLQPIADAFWKLTFFSIIFFMIITLLKLLFGSKIIKLRGAQGERKISYDLSNLDPNQYFIIQDLMIPSQGQSKNTQIDHVVVSNYGIFCIETKAYKGWIFGDANQDSWTQVIYQHKERFYNPLRQNYAHMKALEALLGGELKSPIIALVVFPYAGKLKISGTDNVLNQEGLLAKINSYQNFVYSNEERDRIYHLLTNNNILDKDERKAHAAEVRNIKKY